MTSYSDFDSSLIRELGPTSTSAVIEYLSARMGVTHQIAKPGAVPDRPHSDGYLARSRYDRTYSAWERSRYDQTYSAWEPLGTNPLLDIATLGCAARGLTLAEADASTPMEQGSYLGFFPHYTPPCCWDRYDTDPPPIPKRTLWTCTTLSSRKGMDGRMPATEADAVLVSSLLEGDNNIHAPVLDFDFPCRLVPSTKPGHYHFYIDVAIPWRKYKKMLEALADVGLIQSGFAENSIARQQTMLIREGLTKEDLAKRGVKILSGSGAPLEE